MTNKTILNFWPKAREIKKGADIATSNERKKDVIGQQSELDCFYKLKAVFWNVLRSYKQSYNRLASSKIELFPD